jgi:superfamily II DNA or RNA helicase
MRATQALFQAIQEAASRPVWSRGVELVRAEAVSGEKSKPEEVVLRVSTRQGLKTPTVTLYPEDEDWECSCQGEEDPCEHVTAAIIALRKARKEGDALPKAASSTGRLRYRFDSQGKKSLSLTREVVTGERVLPLEHSLTALAAGRVSGPRFDASGRDMKVERILGIFREPVLPREAMIQLFDALADCERVILDGEPVAVSSERVLPLARVVDAPGGVRLFVEQDGSVTRTFGSGVVLSGDTLRAMGDPKFDGREREQLPRGQFFSNDQLGELVSEVLPSLEARIPVRIETDRLPATQRGDPPRVQIASAREGDQLSILPSLVYGDPPSARVDAGRLVHIQGPLPLRDPAAERSALVELERGLGLKAGRKVVLSGEEAIEFADRLAGWRGDLQGDAHRAFFRAPELIPALEVASSTFDVSFSLPADSESGRPGRAGVASAESVIGAWRRGDSMVSLNGGGFAPLPADWLARFGHRIADLLAARDPRGEVPACVLPDLGRLCEDLDEPAPPQLGGLRPLLENFSGIPPAPLPSDLRAELREYQRHGVDWLHFLRGAGLGALLADDMGLGKTLQTICALESRALVVVPTSLIHNWSEELERFRPGLRVSTYHGPKRTLDREADVVLTSYAIMRLDNDQLAEERWRTLVLDEAQNIKNPESQVAQAAQAMEADFRIALTGTPVENRLEELWSQLHFLNRGLLGGRRDFQDRYARPIGEGDASAASRLRDRVRPFVLRRLKRDVAPELPPRSDVVLHCELSAEERDVYDSVRAASLSRVVESLRDGGNMMEALEALLRLRQAACHPGLVPGQDAERSTKVDLLVERLSQAFEDGHKALVFSQWTSFLDRVEPALGAAGIAFERLDGSTRDRPGVIRRFDDAEGASVMLISLRAGGTGLNLTSADHVFLLDPWWNPAVEDQAADRAHRIGQTRPVVVHRLVALGTVEERILELHARKRALSEAALGEGGGGSGLTRDDLLALLDD